MNWLKKKYHLFEPTLLAIIFFLGPIVFFALVLDFEETVFPSVIATWLTILLYFGFKESERKQKIIDYFNEKHRDEYLEIEKELRKKQ